MTQYAEWPVVGGTPGGSSGQIQFNGSGQFDGDSNLVWDDTNKRVGIQAGTPQAPFHAASSVGSTIANVTSGSVSTSTAVALTPPSGSATATKMYDAPASASAVESSGTGYVSSGQTIDYLISAVKYVGGTYYVSSNSVSASYTDISNDGHDFQVTVDWDAVTGADYYLVQVQVNGGGYGVSKLVPSNSWVDDGAAYSETGSAWPTYYVTNETNSTAPTSLSASENTSYSGLTSDGTTYKVEIDSYITIGGVSYSSGSPYALSPDYYDGNTSNTFGLQIDQSGGGGTGYVVRISTDGGSNWNYYDIATNGSFVYYGQSSETPASTIWSNPFSSFTGKLYYYRIYDVGTTPLGNPYYSGSYSSWTVNIPNDNSYYLVDHTLSGLIGSAKVIASPDGMSYGHGKLVSDSFVDTGFEYWSDGATVTPTGYGYSGTNQVNSYRIYAYDGSIYSQTPLTLTTSNTGGSKYYTLSWSLPSGITQVKITKSVNGGAYSAAKSVTGSSLIDTSDQTWPASTTVTPNTVVPLTGRIDSGQSSTTEPPALAIVNTYGSGNRTSMIAFGIASNSASAATYQSYVFGTSSNGNLNLVCGDVRYAANLSSWASGTFQTLMRGNVNTGSLSFGTIAANSTATATISVTNAALNDMVLLGPPSGLEAGLIATGIVSTPGLVTVRLHNGTTGSITVSTLTWRVAVVKNT